MFLPDSLMHFCNKLSPLSPPRLQHKIALGATASQGGSWALPGLRLLISIRSSFTIIYLSMAVCTTFPWLVGPNPWVKSKVSKEIAPIYPNVLEHSVKSFVYIKSVKIIFDPLPPLPHSDGSFNR